MNISISELDQFYAKFYPDVIIVTEAFKEDGDFTVFDEAQNYYSEVANLWFGAIRHYGYGDIIDRRIDEAIADRKRGRKKEFQYIVTFTLKEDINKNEVEKVEQYIKKQFHREPLKILRADIVREYTEQGRAHWHVAVITKKWLKKDRFNYYIKKYGFIDISKSQSTNYDHRLTYINKKEKSEQIV